MTSIERLAAEARDWCLDAGLPFWYAHGLDRVFGGPVETLTLGGVENANAPFKRTRVVARQLYVFSHAETLGWPQARDAADHLYAYLAEKVWRGPANGWPRTVHPETGVALDPTLDLYDFAFAMFALGWRHRATGDQAALALAHQTLDLIEARFRHPAGGFHHELPPGLPRQQNPHMHLIEAALVLAETSREQRFADLANEIAALFRTRLCRLPEGVLPEFFEEDWTPVAGDKGRWIEPGHQFEWAWILAQHQKLTGANNADVVRALVTWAESHGVDQASQVTFNGVRDDGVPLDKGSRAWPNTERIKGWLGLFELTGADPRAQVEGSARLLLDRYLGPPSPPGGWRDAFDAEGRAIATTQPASTLYHVFLAFAELIRLAPALSRA